MIVVFKKLSFLLFGIIFCFSVTVNSQNSILNSELDEISIPDLKDSIVNNIEKNALTIAVLCANNPSYYPYDKGNHT